MDWLDYGAWIYDNQIARWLVLDPKSIELEKWSPYIFSANDPIRLIDRDGIKWKDAVADQQIADGLQNRIKTRKKEEESMKVLKINTLERLETNLNIRAKLDSEKSFADVVD